MACSLSSQTSDPEELLNESWFARMARRIASAILSAPFHRENARFRSSNGIPRMDRSARKPPWQASNFV
jgi:hypothetical protein